MEIEQDELDKMIEDLSKQKLNDLLSPVDLTKIVTLDKQRGIIFIGGTKAEDIRLNNLKAEAEFFLQSDLWKLIYESPKELASRAMFVDDGKLENQLLKGRAMLYLLDTQKTIIKVLQSYIAKPNTKKS